MVCTNHVILSQQVIKMQNFLDIRVRVGRGISTERTKQTFVISYH